MQLSLCTDRLLLRSTARSVRHLLISLSAPTAPPRASRMPVNLALVLDRSGSMAGEQKFSLARDAVEQSLRMLRPEDRFTLVVYDHDVDVLVTSTPASTEAKRLAVQALSGVEPRGSTNLHAGWMAGANEVATRMTTEGINRLLLLTDGLANDGLTEPARLASLAAELRQRGITTSTFGVGNDFDERLLRDIAHEGGGNFYFIESPLQIPDLLTSELGEALEVVARNVALQIALPARTEARLLNRFRSTHAAGDNELRVELGDLTSGQELSVVVRLRFAHGTDAGRTAVRVGVASGDQLAQLAEREMTWNYASHEENDRQPRDRIVDRAAATLYAARARAEATEANRNGDYPRARLVLETTARRIRGYASGDPELERLWRALLSEVETFGLTAMSPRSLKQAMFVAESAARSRAPDGKARRSRRST
jgi:Ca-activated chloride channel homolog